MFAFKPRKEFEIAVRILLIAVILFNALALNPVTAQAKQQEETIKTRRLENLPIRIFPTFARPSTRITGRDQYRNDFPMHTLASMQKNKVQADAGGEEGLRLAQDWFGASSGVQADWIAQKSGGSGDETLTTFFSSPIPSGASILHNYVGSFNYTVKQADIGPGNWISFQLAGILTASDIDKAGSQRANFNVDIVSPSGLPVTCDNHTDAYLTAICIQDSISHVHGMADSGGVLTFLGFNGEGGFARFAVNGLTTGQKLIVSFGNPSSINNLNTLSSSPLDCRCGAAGASQGIGGKPINTRTGNYEYYTDDISIPTSAGNLSFTRDYVSATTSLNSTLSPGWTHNLATRLIFSSDPEGMPNKVLFKAHTANKYIFNFNSVSNTYTPEPGFNATLVQNQGSPATYTLKDSGQKIYTFDVSGKLVTYADAQVHTWTYTYLGDGKLDQITADGGKFLNLDYDSQGRVNLVKDQSNRSVSYHYSINGDLDSFTDLVGKTWTYEYSDPNLNHYLTRVAAPGNVTVERQEYYPDGKAWRQYDGEDNLIIELIYNANGSTTIKDALGNTETHTYHARGTLVADNNWTGKDSGKLYDTNFRPNAISDRLNHWTSLTWSADGTNLTQIQDTLHNQTTLSYGVYNNPTSILDPSQHQTNYYYNDSNFPSLPTRVEYPLSFDGGATYI